MAFKYSDSQWVYIDFFSWNLCKILFGVKSLSCTKINFPFYIKASSTIQTTSQFL